jgi:heat shock protein HslJ
MKTMSILLLSLTLLACGNSGKMGKDPDPEAALKGRWVAAHIAGEALEGTKGLPELEIQVEEKRYSGTDGCNNYMGGLIELDEESIRFGVAAGTRMACPDMRIADLFNRTLPEVRSYQRMEGSLHLYDADGKEIMVLERGP